MDNTGVHGKDTACLCQIQDSVWDWPSLWHGLSGTSEDQHFAPLLFYMLRVPHRLQTYLKKSKKSEIISRSRRKIVTFGTGNCHCLMCSEYHEDSIAPKPEMERRKQKRKEKKKQNPAIFTYFADFKIMPIFVLIIWRQMQAYNSSHWLPATWPAHKREKKAGIWALVVICGLQTSSMPVTQNKNTKCCPDSPLRPVFISFNSHSSKL